MGAIPGLTLVNGYLLETGRNSVTKGTVSAFSNALPNMQVLGVRDVDAIGLMSDRHTYSKAAHKVDLIYASAVPFGVYGNSNSPNMRKIVQMTLFGQYVASLRFALARKNCEIHLMPLGGGAFGVNPVDTKSAMISAVEYLRSETPGSDVFKEEGVDIKLILYEKAKTEEKSFYIF